MRSQLKCRKTPWWLRGGEAELIHLAGIVSFTRPAIPTRLKVNNIDCGPGAWARLSNSLDDGRFSPYRNSCGVVFTDRDEYIWKTVEVLAGAMVALKYFTGHAESKCHEYGEFTSLRASSLLSSAALGCCWLTTLTLAGLPSHL